MTGANRISKTFSTSGVSVCLALRGCFPWEDPNISGRWFWELRNWEPPIKIRIIGQDWEKHVKVVVVPALKELLPKSWGIIPRKNNLGVEAQWLDPATGSQIEIMSNNSESAVFEGAKFHMLIHDEPPKRDNRIASIRGLVDYCGIEIFAMTLLSEAWVDKDVINATLPDGTPDPTVWSIVGDIQQNVGFGLTQEGVDQFAKALTDDEKSARLRGVPSYKAGLILKIDKKVHMVERFKIKAHWPVDIAIDIHPAKPQHILFIATDERNFKYVCFEIVGHGDGEWVADEIIKKVKTHNLRVNRIIIDPFAKGDQNNENSTYDKINRALGRYGYFIQVATKDKDDGILIINSLLWTANNMPALFFFRDLPVFVRQATNWMWADPKEMASGQKEVKASKQDDDQCENLYRLMLLNTQYDEPEDDDYSPQQSQSKNHVTGY